MMIFVVVVVVEGDTLGGHHFTSMRATFGAKVMLSPRRNGGVQGQVTSTIIYIRYNNIQQLLNPGDAPIFLR